MKKYHLFGIFTLMSLFVILMGVGFSLDVNSAHSAQTDMSADEAACLSLLDVRDLVIVDAKIVVSDSETYCRVSGITGQIHYAVKLPVAEQWNGRFLMNGDGGHDGDIDLVNFTGTDTTGYAVANSDMGHSRVTEPGSTFAFNNRQAEIDYGYRAVHTTVLAAKHLIQQFYGRPPDFSYFDGCSTGGRQAAVEAQRYPDDFDGIVAGALFNNAIEIAMEQVWSSALFIRDVDGDGVGFDNLISQEDIDALEATVLDAVDVLGNDRIRDGVVNNPLAASEVFTEADIDAFGEARGLTDGQIQAIKDVYAGPHDSTGQNQWYSGKPIGTEYAWGFYVIPTEAPFPDGNGMVPFQTGFSATFVNELWFEHDPGRPTANPLDPSLLPGEGEFRWIDFDFDRNTPTGGTTNPVVGPWNPDDGGAFMREILNGSETDLTPFLVNNDAKYLIYHGWGDGLIPGGPTVDYYNGIVADTFGGDVEAASNNIRLFMVPGMGHCADEFGTGSASEWDKLAPLVEWVENDNAPDSIVVTHTNSDGVVDNERIICTWPLQPTYIGPMDGAENDPVNWVASNFECQPQEE
ncbi:MAG: tannase/feruloyl esterase family alpha/beta hydrolase [Chloroflexi bacterium]|nr:MAG: hypothetical protein CUN54_06170 [Phototrophicales bacterium]RMF77626.1 MAG: tannase/feruloyl esterase family alpha/beta hydrolase [Chloroflexota bacterium]